MPLLSFCPRHSAIMCMLEHAGTSDQGRVRYRNEDFIAHHIPGDVEISRRKGSLFIIADGVGGSGAGDVASREASQMLEKIYYEGDRRPDRALRAAFSRANMHIYDMGLKRGQFKMETTLSALALVGDRAYIGHVGDTRIYRIRSVNDAEQLTRDHSEVAELVRMQLLAPENVRGHPRRHVITQSLGSDPMLRPMFRTEDVREGDTFLLCTDGLWEPVQDGEFARVAAEHSAAEACRRLVDLGLERQTTDNLSVQIIKVLGLDKENTTAPPNHSWWQSALRRFHK